MAKETKKTCFIVMPITTPESLRTHYSNDENHFIHVMDHLFIPAIADAGFTPIKPISKGSDVIHTDIIRNLEEADLVIIDMSVLNANVFFEMGIRTALNKPTTLVFDGNSKYKVPFDTAIINYHTYNPNLDAWVIDKEKERLSVHIKDSFEKTPTYNGLWRVFGLQEAGKTSISSTDSDNLSIDLLKLQISGLSTKIERLIENQAPQTFSSSMNIIDPSRVVSSPSISIKNALIKSHQIQNSELLNQINNVFDNKDPFNRILELQIDESSNNITLVTSSDISNDAFLEIKELAGKHGMSIRNRSNS